MTGRTISKLLSGNGSVTSTYGMYELNVTEAGRYTFTISSDDDLDNRLYDVHMNQIQMTSHALEEGTYRYDLPLSVGIYYLRVAYADTTNSGAISINIKPHSHNCDQWTYYTHATHIESCSCGYVGTVTSAHAVMASEIVDNCANCLGCGHWLNFYFDIAQVLSDQATQVSVNGSYILPNGIVVLADEDVDAYFNGTLVFYNRDDVPLTE